jgi:hypothetical protein
MRPDGIKLPAWQRWTVYLAFGVLFVTGVAWSLLHDGLPRLGYEALSELAVVPLLLDIHGAAAMAALLVLGSLLPQHIKWAWSGRLNRFTGGLILATQGLFIATGYALYYVGDETLRAYASDLHLLLGLGLPLVLVGHIVVGRRQRAALLALSSAAAMQEEYYANFTTRATDMARKRKIVP